MAQMMIYTSNKKEIISYILYSGFSTLLQVQIIDFHTITRRFFLQSFDR